jgi:hypothetical protein
VKSEIGWIRDPFIVTDSGTEFPTDSVFRTQGGVDQAGTEIAFEIDPKGLESPFGSPI